jgi:hypothetical protein
VADAYFADTGRFPHETIDGETVLIDAAKGHLFLFAGTGPWLWLFLEHLVEPQMLLPGKPPSAPAAAVPSAPWPATFVEPVIERHDEIADIMDPIHDVDPAMGWPHRPDGGA